MIINSGHTERATRCSSLVPPCAGFKETRRGQSGMALLATLIVLLIISTLGASMLLVSSADMGASANYRGAKAAFYEADSGIQRSIMDLVANSNWSEASVDGSLLPILLRDPFPTSVTINGNTINLSGGAGWYPFGPTENLGNGTFTREIWLPPTDSEQANAKGSKLWLTVPVRSTGAVPNGSEPSTQRVESDLRVMIFRVSIWDNAIFAGEGQAGKSINGNVEVRGSVHVVGDPNNPTLLDWGGGATVGNNYVDAALASYWDVDWVKLPSLPVVEINGEWVQSLDAEVRVKNGDLDFGGSSSLGNPDATGNTRKETLDGFYADGTVTLSGTAAIHADANEDKYDIKATIPFPSLNDPFTDPVTGVFYASHRDYLNTVGLTLPENQISDNTPAFSVSDGSGNSADWDPVTSILQINGICRVDGDLMIGRNGATLRVQYSGTGTIYATNDIDFRWDLMPVGGYLNALDVPMNNIGLIADSDVNIATAGGATWLKLMAAVYAEDTITIAKQTRIAGSLVGKSFNLGNNVPQVWQVPKLAVNLPPGMPGGDPLMYAQRSEVSNWMHVRR
jgi:hypothetical protein